MNILPIINQKGGVGKTVTSLNLAVNLGAKRSKKVLAIDLDEQANLTSTLALAPGQENEYNSIYNVFTGEKNINEIIIKDKYRIDLIPSNANLSNIYNELTDFEFLKHCIEEIKETYDFIIIDNHPSSGILVMNCLLCATRIIVPVQPEPYAMDGLINFVTNLIEIGIHDKINVLLTQVDIRKKKPNEYKASLGRNFGKRFFNTFIREAESVNKANEDHTPLIFHKEAKNSTACQDYLELSKEVIKVCRK